MGLFDIDLTRPRRARAAGMVVLAAMAAVLGVTLSIAYRDPHGLLLASRRATQRPNRRSVRTPGSPRPAPEQVQPRPIEGGAKDVSDDGARAGTLGTGQVLTATAGVDWAKDDHAVAVVDRDGREVARRLVPHSTEGLRGLISFLRRHEVAEVGIERPDGQVVDALLAAGLTVVVISPRQIKSLRSRYGSAGNKTWSQNSWRVVPRLGCVKKI